MNRLALIATLALAACSSAPPYPAGDQISRMSSLSPIAHERKSGGLGIDWAALLKGIGSSDSTGGTR